MGNGSVGFLILAAAFALVPLVKGSDNVSTFRSHSHGYIVQYPASWHLQLSDDVFYIESFPASEAIRALRIPQGGAGIKILVPSQVIRSGQRPPDSMEEWMKMGVGRQTEIGRRVFRLHERQQDLSVIEVRTQCCAGSADQESIEWYFELHGHFFEGVVIYWPGDPNAEKFRETLKQVVLSLKVAPEAARNERPLRHGGDPLATLGLIAPDEFLVPFQPVLSA